MKRILFTVLFLVIWLPCLLFTSTNATTAERLSDPATLAGPYPWKYLDRSLDWETIPPRMLLKGRINVVGNEEEFTLDADFIEWLYSGKKASSRHKVKKGPVYKTQLPHRPWVSEWDVAHDAGMKYSIAGLRFNGMFLMGLFMCLLLPPLFVLWLMADDITIVTPQERKRRDDAFLELVKIVEARAKGDPGWLQKKTIRLALLGYAVVLGSILLMIPVGLGLGAAALVIGGGNAGAAKLGFILAAVPIGFAFVMAKSLLLPGYQMPGTEIHPQDAPQLFACLDHIIREAKGPRFKRVFITNEMNASVSRHTGPLGFFGFGPVTLSLGLPLMQALTLPQLGGVIGHEYGHVAAKDNALGQWVYRIRTSWLVLGDRLQLEQLWYALKLNRFYSWFIGVFSAYSFALSRQCEYEADAFAAKLAGAENAAAALCAVAVRADELDKFYWRDLWQKARENPGIAGEAPYTRMADYFAAARDQSAIVDAVQKEETGYASTHPSTMDRVKALGHGFIHAPPVTKSAAAELLGPLEMKLADAFDRDWHGEAEPHWVHAHEEHKQHLARLAALKNKPLAGQTRDELSEMIAAGHTAKDDGAVIAACEELLKREPDNAAAKLNIAGLKLAAGDESRLADLEQIIKDDPQMFASACSHAIAFYHEQKRPLEAKPWEEKLSAWNYERDAAEEERGLVLATDQYDPHGLTAEEVGKLAQHAAAHKAIHTLYVARKKVKYMPEYPSYLVSFRLKYQPFRSQKKVQEDVNAFINGTGLGGAFLFIPVDAVAGLEGKMKKTETARVYSVKDKGKAA